MEEQINHCDGVFKKELFINNSETPLPYCPHILNNSVYKCCLAHDIEWEPFKEFCTYDFDTMECIIDNYVISSTLLNSFLKPILVASSIKTKDSITTKSIDIRADEFISKWIIYLFEQAESIHVDKTNYLISLL